MLTASQHALGEPLPDPATATEHVFFPSRYHDTSPKTEGDATSMTFGAAVNEALRRELAETPEVIVFGEDVAFPGGIFGVTRGLQREFGGARVFDTPIAESAILGAALGAAQDGFRPIAEIMWSDFLLVALDQLVNQAANVRYLHQGLLDLRRDVRPPEVADKRRVRDAVVRSELPKRLTGRPAPYQLGVRSELA